MILSYKVENCYILKYLYHISINQKHLFNKTYNLMDKKLIQKIVYKVNFLLINTIHKSV